jgi:hypothetical protein
LGRVYEDVVAVGGEEEEYIFVGKVGKRASISPRDSPALLSRKIREDGG